MKIRTRTIREGYDGKRCLVHARCCETPDFLLATAQYLEVEGCDLFSGILMSQSYDGGESWSEFKAQAGLAPIKSGDIITVCCDATPMYHNKTGRTLLLGITTHYKEDSLSAVSGDRKTFYSVFDTDKNEFSNCKFIDMPSGFEFCGNGCGQSVELPDGDLLIPVYYTKEGLESSFVTVLRCSFDGENVKLLEIGSSHTIEIARGLCEPSVICHRGVFYMTLRNDECGLVAKSADGLHYSGIQLWKWDDGSILQNYNTQQHFMEVGGELYLVYTRRADTNDRVFRHRAPLFAARVENMRLVKESEVVLTPEKGARLGNFGATNLRNGRAAVMAAEWMQPVGCEKYGSNNCIYFTLCEQT